MGNQGWHLRGLTSLFTTAGFLVMSATGLIAYIVPQGRIAYWTDWHFLGLSKVQWGNIHIISSLLFIAAGAFHIWFNWKALMNYLLDRTRGGLKLKKEIALASVVTVLVIAAGIRPFPPFGWLIDLNGFVKAAWVRTPDYEPPFGHAEEVSLKTLASKQGIDLKEAITALEEGGYGSVDAEKKLIEIAGEYGTTPQVIYSLIKPLEKREPSGSVPSFTSGLVEERFAGTGIGNKTLDDVAAMTGEDAAKIRARLDVAAISMGDDVSIKKAADVNNLIAPIELLKVMLVDGYEPDR